MFKCSLDKRLALHSQLPGNPGDFEIKALGTPQMAVFQTQRLPPGMGKLLLGELFLIGRVSREE